MDKTAARSGMNLNPDKFTVMITGGSQGSVPLNKHLYNKLEWYRNQAIQLVWQCGKWDYARLSAEINDADIHLYNFISDMSMAYSASDLVISRSGAIALAELMLCGKATALVPFPQAAGNHQVQNAKVLADGKAALLVEQKYLQDGMLEKEILKLMENPDERRQLEKNALKMALPHAGKVIADEVEKLI